MRATRSPRRRRSTSEPSRSNADVFEAHFNLGNIFHDLGRYAEAQRLLSRGAAAEPDLCRRALLSGGDAGEERAVAGRAPALARVSAAGARRRVGESGEGVFRVSVEIRIEYRSSSVVVVRGCASSARGAACSTGSPGTTHRHRTRSCPRTASPRGACRTRRCRPPAAAASGTNRSARTPADCGLSDVTRPASRRPAAGVRRGAGPDAVAPAIAGRAGRIGSLLKLNANGFLQRAQRAHFFGSDQRQRAPG